nr:hypothetical protein [Corynebacterium durum]
MIGNDGGRACGIPHPVILACQQQDISLEVFHLDAGLDAGARQRNG